MRNVAAPFDDWPDWSGEAAAVVGGGASATAIAPLLVGRCRLIVVNLAFRLLPSADVLYAADSGFWGFPAYRDAWSFKGLKIAPKDQRCQRLCKRIREIVIPYRRSGIRYERLIKRPLGEIGNGGGNGGFQAFNLALQFGANPIYLVGLDYGGSHWHADHPPGLRNPSADQFRRWRELFDAEASTLAEWGIDVVNLSPISALRNFRREEARRLFDDQRPTALSQKGF